MNRKAPFGNDLIEQIKHIPKYEIKVELMQENNAKIIKLRVKLLNLDSLVNKMTVEENSYMNLLVGDDDNNVLLYEKYK